MAKLALTELVRQLRGHFLGRTEWGEIARAMHDDFWGDAIDVRWNTAVTGSGVAAALQSTSPSRLLLDTGTTISSTSEINEGGVTKWNITDKLTVRVRSRMSGLATLRHIPIALQDTATERILLEYDTASGDTGWVLRTVSGGGTTTSPAILAARTDWTTFWLAAESGSVRARIEGASAIVENTANIPAGDMEFRSLIGNNAAASRTSQLDYVTIWPGKTLF